MSVKDTKAEVNTITYDRDKIEEKVGSIYEAIVIMGKRAEQINAEIRTELHQKLLKTTKDYQNPHLSPSKSGLKTKFISEELMTELKNIS